MQSFVKHSSLAGHLGFFQCFVIINNVEKKMFIASPPRLLYVISLACIPMSEKTASKWKHYI